MALHVTHAEDATQAGEEVSRLPRAFNSVQAATRARRQPPHRKDASWRIAMRVLEDEALSPEDTTFVRSATGSLLYLSRCARPDITHAVMILTRSVATPGPRARNKLKRVLRYRKGTTSVGICYSADAEQGDVLTASVDSDFAGDGNKGYSTTRVVLFLAGGPVEWNTPKQSLVATPSLESEFVALSKACQIIKHFRHLMDTIHETQHGATVVWEDNVLVP